MNTFSKQIAIASFIIGLLSVTAISLSISNIRSSETWEENQLERLDIIIQHAEVLENNQMKKLDIIFKNEEMGKGDAT
jgi:hypothetical protein